MGEEVTWADGGGVDGRWRLQLSRRWACVDLDLRGRCVAGYWWMGRLGWCCEDVVGTGRFAQEVSSRKRSEVGLMEFEF